MPSSSKRCQAVRSRTKQEADVYISRPLIAWHSGAAGPPPIGSCGDGVRQQTFSVGGFTGALCIKSTAINIIAKS
jgi:hypothetical protein